jgi:hypothetical protein
MLLAERHGGRRVVPRGVLDDHAAVRKDPPIRRHVDIGERRAPRLEEPLLIPSRNVVVVSRDRHCSDSFDSAKPQRTSICAAASPRECHNSGMPAAARASANPESSALLNCKVLWVPAYRRPRNDVISALALPGRLSARWRRQPHDDVIPRLRHPTTSKSAGGSPRRCRSYMVRKADSMWRQNRAVSNSGLLSLFAASRALMSASIARSLASLSARPS